MSAFRNLYSLICYFAACRPIAQPCKYVVAGVLVAFAALLHSLHADEISGIPNTVSGRPNVIWILLDACRPDMKCFGYERDTSPNIDALAARGAIFEKHFTQASSTVFSVPTYMTGRYYPAPCMGEYGAFEEYTHVKLPNPRERLLPDVLRENGYATAMITQADVWFSNSDRLPRAFDQFISLRPRKPPLVTFQEINEAVTKYLDSPPSAPFFLYLHTWDTHFPHALVPPYDHWVDPGYDASIIQQNNAYGARRQDNEPFNDADIAYLRAVYDGSILYADTQIGELIRMLETRGMLDNTILIISADHGEALGEDRRTVGHVGPFTFDEIAHVPFILAGPGIPAGTRVRRLTESIDIFPTLVDVLDLETDAVVDGKSLLPVLRAEDTPDPHEFVFTKVGGMQPLLAMRGEHFRYEYNITTEKESLYPVPDHLATRKDISQQYPDLTAEMRRVLIGQMAPRWRERERLPMMACFLAIRRHLAPGDSSKQAVIQNVPGQHPLNFGQDDGKWLLFQGQLFAASFAEDVVPLEVHAAVENGAYRILLEMFSAADYGGHPASSVSIILPGDTAPRVIASPPVSEPKGRYVYADLGTLTIETGEFSAAIDDGDREHWAGVKSIVLVSQTEAAQAEFNRLFDWETASQDEINVNIEQLDAMGYIDSH